MAFSTAEKLARLRLIRSENVGPVTFRHLIGRYGNAIQALEELPDLARRGGRNRPIRVCASAAAEAELKLAARAGAVPLWWGDDDYPPALAAIEDAPPVLYTLGHAYLMGKPVVAIVGARNASAAGRRMAGVLAEELGKAGYVVVSGLARGIDGVAHASALTSGTIAVLAGGIDIIYPREHEELYARIARQGLIVSEMPPGTEPQARHFPRRNRIISGLARGVVVIEASARSGSLITARAALDQGREVFAVPGSPLDPRAAGPNSLIRDGATLTESASDILNVFASMDQRRVREPAPVPGGGTAPANLADDAVESARTVLLELLSPTPVAMDDLVRETALAPAIMMAAALELELAGRLERHPGNRVSILPE